MIALVGAKPEMIYCSRFDRVADPLIVFLVRRRADAATVFRFVADRHTMPKNFSEAHLLWRSAPGN